MTDTTHDDLVKRICEEWVKDGRSEDCFWEGWPECPTPEDSLTPRMVIDRIEELESERSKAMGHALALATTLHRNFYKTQAPNWEPLEDVVGVITQIDNMIIGVADRVEELSNCVAVLEAKLTQQGERVQAAVAAALREAADAIADYPRVAPDATEAQHYDEQIEYCQSIILALITPDAQAALDRVRREAWVEGSDAGWLVGIAAEQERCAQVAFDAGCGWQALRTAALSSSWPEDAAKHLASEQRH
jgi:hypothetical protein